MALRAARNRSTLRALPVHALAAFAPISSGLPGRESFAPSAGDSAQR